MFFDDSFNAEVFLTFIKRLVNESGRKIYLIVDNLKSHHAIIVKEWIEKHNDKIKLFFLPPYCPEYNPDEYLNGNLKRELEKKGYAKSKKEMESNARSVLMSFQRDKNHVAGLFKAKNVKYAAGALVWFRINNMLDMPQDEAAERKDEILQAVQYLCGKNNPIKKYQGGKI